MSEMWSKMIYGQNVAVRDVVRDVVARDEMRSEVWWSEM